MRYNLLSYYTFSFGCLKFPKCLPITITITITINITEAKNVIKKLFEAFMNYKIWSWSVGVVTYFLVFFALFVLPTQLVLGQTAGQTKIFLKQMEEGDYTLAESTLSEMLKGEALDPFENLYTYRKTSEKWSVLYNYIPALKDLESMVNRSEGNMVTEEEYRKILRDFHAAVAKSLGLDGNLKGKDHIQALYRGLYDLSLIKSQTKFTSDESQKKEVADGDEMEEEREKNKEQEKPEDNPWESSKDQYKPRNKPFETEEGSAKQNKAILVETDAPLVSPLLANHIFDSLTSERWSRAAVGRVKVYEDTDKKYSFKVHTYGQNNIPLPIPLTYRPVSSSPDVTIMESNPGEYILVNNGKKSIVELQIIKQKLTTNPGVNRKIAKKYLTPSGIDKGKWPREILDMIDSVKEETSDPLKRVQRMARYLKKNFKYYSANGLKKEELAEVDRVVKEAMDSGDPSPVAFCKAKVVQCDGAAWILSSLARDFLDLPARPVSGRTAVMRGKQAVVRVNDPKHAWIQVWIDGTGWVEVDATPPDASAKKEKEKEKNKDKPIKADDDEIDGKEGKDDKTDSKDKEGKDDESKSPKNKDKQDKDNADLEENGTALDEIDETMQKKDEHFRPLEFLKIYFKERLTKAFENLANAKGKIQDMTEIAKEMEKISGGFERAKPYLSQVKNVLDEEEQRLHELRQTDSAKLLANIDDKVSSNELRDVYYLIKSLKQDFVELAKWRALSPSEESYQQLVQSVISRLEEFRHPKSADFDQVERLWKNLPGPLTKKWLRKQYGEGVLTLGHVENSRLALDLQGGKLNNLLPLSKVSDYIGILLEKSRKPEYEALYFGKETMKKQKRSVRLTTKHLQDLPYSILPNKPLDDILQDCLDGRIYRYGYRHPVVVERPVSQNEEIITLVLVDESGSMQGQRTDLAQAMIGGFIDKARGQAAAGKSPTGKEKVKHDVVVIPFSHDIGKIETVRNDDEAETYLKSVLKGERVIMDGGTDIEKALVEAYKKIASSFTKKLQTGSGSGKDLDLRKANIWLLTDGGSEINPKTLKKARENIPEDVHINLNVVFVGEKNKELENFLNQQKGHHPQFTKFISDQDIGKLMAKEESPVPAKDAFATEQGTMQLKGSLISDLRKIKTHFQYVKKPVGGRVKNLTAMYKGMDWDRKPKMNERNTELEILLEHIKNNKKELVQNDQFIPIMAAIHDQINRKNRLQKLSLFEFDKLKGLLQD